MPWNTAFAETEEFHFLCQKASKGEISFGNAAKQLGWSYDAFVSHFKHCGYVQERRVNTKDLPAEFHEIAKAVECGYLTKKEACKKLGVSGPYFLKEYRNHGYKPFIGQITPLSTDQKLELAALFKRHIFPMEASIIMGVPYFLVEREVRRLMGWE